MAPPLDRFSKMDCLRTKLVPMPIVVGLETSGRGLFVDVWARSSFVEKSIFESRCRGGAISFIPTVDQNRHVPTMHTMAIFKREVVSILGNLSVGERGDQKRGREKATRRQTRFV